MQLADLILIFLLPAGLWTCWTGTSGDRSNMERVEMKQTDRLIEIASNTKMAFYFMFAQAARMIETRSWEFSRNSC